MIDCAFDSRVEGHLCFDGWSSLVADVAHVIHQSHTSNKADSRQGFSHEQAKTCAVHAPPRLLWSERSWMPGCGKDWKLQCGCAFVRGCAGLQSRRCEQWELGPRLLHERG